MIVKTEREYVIEEKKPVGRPRNEAPKRGRGRPRKDEVVEPKKFVKHDRPNINPKNTVKYCEQTIRNAERIYKKYDGNIPNPLNIDEKDLCEEAREAWKYAFSTRENYDPLTVRERVIYSGQELLMLFESYCSYIRKNNYMKSFNTPEGEIKLMPMVPNQSNFALWLGIPRGCISASIRDSDDSVAQEYKAMLGDLLSEGAMVGAYQSTSAIFSLKNLCDWADKYEDKSKPEQKTTVEEAEALMKSLGYNVPKLNG